MNKHKKLFRLIWNVNGILLFIGLCITGILLLTNFISSVIPKSAPVQRVQVIKKTETKPVPVEYEINFNSSDGELKDCLVFEVRSNIIRMDPNVSANSGPQKPIVNLIFVMEPDGKPKRLFPRNVLIPYYLPACFQKDNPYHRTIFPKNLYELVTADTNQNGQLDDLDRRDLYISDYNGSGLTKIKENMLYFRNLTEKQVLITSRINRKYVYEVYDITTGKLSMILDQNNMKLD